jgi:hypothetical protein
MQIIVPIEVCKGSASANLELYVRNLRRVFAADGFPSVALPLVGWFVRRV